ncbi:helix-turn-helix domain-containing protein [Sandaracinomonas limnophila]|uniref:helix-turn-helix domain-containing protein n=1 Tax=Sandaracinomonas limnophila TaxID=1862386 RepID=UPI0013E3D830|nr:helix-turn-helix domain-containing protein [Sandaracinomonas limnophila]
MQKELKGSKMVFLLFGIFLIRLISTGLIFNKYLILDDHKLEIDLLAFVLSADMIFTVLYLLFFPNILEDLYFKKYVFTYSSSDPKEVSTAEEKNPYEEAYDLEQQVIFNAVENYLVTKRDFLSVNFTIEKMANDLKIPQRHISHVIKRQTGESVKNYINNKRLAYLIEKYKHDKNLQNLPVDELGSVVGFNSRQTLYSLTQKLYGCSPRELFRGVS